MIHVTATELPRVMQCNGSIEMIEQNQFVAPGDKTIRDEGIAAHWLVDQCAVKTWNKPDHYIDQKAANGVFITSEMAGHVSDYLATVRMPNIEDAFEYETGFAGNNFEIASRIDHFLYDHIGDVLHINDFKYGYKIVEPKENWTLIAHAIGLCVRWPLAPAKVSFGIFQPRARHRDGVYRNWVISYDDLMTLYNQIVNNLDNLTNDLRTGPNCRRCPAMVFCPASSAAGHTAVEESTLAFSENLSNDELSLEMDILRAAQRNLETRLDALEQLAMFRLKKGEIITNYAVEHGKGNWAWRKGVTAEKLAMLTGKDLTNSKLLTPAQARRKINNDLVTDTLFDVLAERPSTGVKLRRIDANAQAAALLNNQSKG